MFSTHAIKTVFASFFAGLLISAQVVADDTYIEKNHHHHSSKSDKHGPTGPKGSTGPTGPKGPTGPTGANGFLTANYISAFDAGIGGDYSAGDTPIIFPSTRITSGTITHTIPTDFMVATSGVYFVSWTTQIEDRESAAGSIILNVFVDGSAQSPADLEQFDIPAGGTVRTLSGSMLLRLNAGQTLQLTARADTNTMTTFNPTINLEQVAP